MSHPKDVPPSLLAEICQRYGVRELSLFGSGARGELGPDSDIDLLIDFGPNHRVGFMELGALEQELERIFNRPVDVVPKRGLRPAFRDEILNSAQLIYAAA